MPLNIDNYSNWANQNILGGRDASAALNPNDGALADIKTTTSGWARFFHTRSFTAQRDAVRADFQRALTERFGSKIATAVMQGVGTDLTASAIAHAVSTARLAASRAMLTPDDGRDLRLTNGHLLINQQTIGGMSLDGRRALGHFIQSSNRTSNLLGCIPAGPAELEEFETAVNTVIRDIATAKTDVLQAFADTPDALPDNGLVKLTRTCDDQVHRLLDHLAHVQTLNAAGPTSQASIDRFRDTWYTAFVQTCTSLQQAPELAGNQQAIHALQNLAQTSKDVFNSEFELSTKSSTFLGSVINESLTTACGTNPLEGETAKKKVDETYQKILNARPWKPIAKTFTGSLAGQTFGLKSTLVPGKHIVGVGESYPSGVNGYMCHSAKEDRHAVNLAVSSLEVEDGQGVAHTAFTGIRHGVHCAWEIPGAEDRATANRNRAAETVKAAFLAYLGQHPGLLDGATLDLPMTSVSLLTPDFARPILAGIKGKNTDNEKMMLLEQTAAWQSVSDQPMDITVNGHTYHVTPRIATFNFGVNSGGVGKLSGLFGGWGVSSEMNNVALTTLGSRVTAFLADPQMSDAKKNAVQTLFAQIGDILNSKGERSDGHDAYKAAARIAVLTSLMDGVPCWNCKSGKDRTGEMDVECKFLSTLIARGMDIPKPGAALTGEQKMLFRAIALEGGNLELQEYNTGIGGFKTGGVSSIPERLGGSEARTFHKGASDFVAV